MKLILTLLLLIIDKYEESLMNIANNGLIAIVLFGFLTRVLFIYKYRKSSFEKVLGHYRSAGSLWFLGNIAFYLLLYFYISLSWIPSQFTPAEADLMLLMLRVLLFVRILLEFFIYRKPIWWEIILVNCFNLIMVVHILQIFWEPRNPVVIDAPMKRWIVFAGGMSPAINGFLRQKKIKHAEFISVMKNNMTTNGSRDHLDDFLCFGETVFAPVGGTISKINTSGIDERFPKDEKEPNYVHIKSNAGYFVFISNLKNGSMKHKLGDQVRSGDKIGECGLSGQITEPGVVIDVYNKIGEDDFESIPFKYRNVKRYRFDKTETGDLYGRRNDVFEKLE
ncbi:MAG: peptidoglycan DD-metalloendopeptidase family protein [Oligoflexales bacterium]|nr:peptidoglycan DD-metalloendopeptidase family protein [Oligoflexales bacterium]